MGSFFDQVKFIECRNEKELEEVTPSTKKTKDKSGEVVVCVKCSKNVEEDSIECESCLKWAGSTVFAREFPKRSVRFLAVTCQPTSCSFVVSVGPRLNWL